MLYLHSIPLGKTRAHRLVQFCAQWALGRGQSLWLRACVAAVGLSSLEVCTQACLLT